jgi:uncharacterized protein
VARDHHAVLGVGIGTSRCTPVGGGHLARTILWSLVGGVLLLYLAGLAWLYVHQRSYIFPGAAHGGATALADPETVRFRTSDGLVLRAVYRSARDGQPTIVFFHGNGDTTAGSRVATQAFARAGYGLLLPEYRGYAGNSGSPSEGGLYKDGRAALQWLMGHGVQSRQIIIMGNSLGSGVATEMALEHKVAALVLVSGFTSMVDVVQTQLPIVPAGLLVRDRFDNARKLARIGCPTLILHGDADTLIPAAQGAALAAASGQAQLDILPGKGHELAYSAIAQDRTLAWLAGIARERSGFNRIASSSGR